jgi:hypothetical protein
MKDNNQICNCKLADLICVLEVVAGHDTLEAVVVGNHEGGGNLVLPVVVPVNLI